MIQLEKTPCFVLKRAPYKESQYLIDLLTKQHGLIRGVARIENKKTHRQTGNFAPFREILVSGQQKKELATLWQSEIVAHYPLNGKQWLACCYLNELLLQNFTLETGHTLYTQYKQAISQPTAANLRQIEWSLIKEQGLLPERAEEASYYKLIQQQQSWLSLIAASSGFAHELILSLEHDILPLNHPQLKNYLQTLLQHQEKAKIRSKNTALSLLKLIKY